MRPHSLMPRRPEAGAPPGIHTPDFVIVGSARSGTTLVQRLACELPGVRVPPETHFFDLFVQDLLERGHPPFGALRLAREVAAWSKMPEVAGTDVDTGRIVAALGGRCESVFHLFAAIVDDLASDAEILGEKTPNHLFWWRPLTQAFPLLRVIAVVRDPRAVVSSTLRTPWGRTMFHPRWGDDAFVAIAERWRVEHDLIEQLDRELPGRCLVLRYEDVVTDPVATRTAIANLLGVSPNLAASNPASPPTGLVLPWETWKSNVGEQIQPELQTSWRRHLTSRQARVVTGLCASRMRARGYAVPWHEIALGVTSLSTLSPLTQRRRRQYEIGLRKHLRSIDGLAL